MKLHVSMCYLKGRLRPSSKQANTAPNLKTWFTRLLFPCNCCSLINKGLHSCLREQTACRCCYQSGREAAHVCVMGQSSSHFCRGQKEPAPDSTKLQLGKVQESKWSPTGAPSLPECSSCPAPAWRDAGFASSPHPMVIRHGDPGQQQMTPRDLELEGFSYQNNHFPQKAAPACSVFY